MNTIVLIPGYMCNEELWKYQIKELKKKYRVIIPNLKKGKTIKEFSLHTLKILPNKFSIIGFSMGGFVALDLSINYHKRVEKLILVGTNGRSVSESRKLLLDKSQNELDNKNYIEKFSSNNFNSYFIKSNQKNRQYLKLIRSMVKRLGYLCLKRQTHAILTRPNLLNKLSKINARCLIIAGSQDRLSSKEMNIELHNKIKNSELFFITKSGHFTMIEQTKKFNKKILNWLDRSD